MTSTSLWTNYFRRDEARDEWIELLSKVYIFASLSRRDLEHVRDLMHVREFGGNEVVFFEGQPGSGMYIIAKGEVRIVLNYGSDHEIELVRLGPGDFFGEFSLIDEAPRSATVVATKPTTLGGFFRPDLLDLLARKPRQGVQIVLNLSEVLTERLRRTNDELRTARDKIAELEERLADSTEAAEA